MSDVPPAPPGRLAGTYEQYLPAVLRGDPVIGGFLLAMEAVLSGLDEARAAELGLPDDLPPGLETVIDAVPTLFDPDTTRADFLPWLAGWVGLSLRADWDEATARAFVKGIVPLYALRGTKAGLEAMLRLYTREPVVVDDEIDDPPHFFQVRLTISDRDEERLRRTQQVARAIIDQEKPAHTFYALQLSVPTMRLPAHLGTPETLLGTETSS